MYWKIRISTLISDSLKAWGLAAGGLVAALGFDFAGRMDDGSMDTGGLPGAVFMLIFLVVAFPVLFYFVRSVTGAPMLIRIILVIAQITIVVILFSAIALIYLCNNGIICS